MLRVLREFRQRECDEAEAQAAEEEQQAAAAKLQSIQRGRAQRVVASKAAEGRRMLLAFDPNDAEQAAAKAMVVAVRAAVVANVYEPRRLHAHPWSR